MSRRTARTALRIAATLVLAALPAAAFAEGEIASDLSEEITSETLTFSNLDSSVPASGRTDPFASCFRNDASGNPDWVYGYDAWTAPLAD